MTSWQKDVIMIVVGWTLRLFTLPISKDMEVKEKCLNSLYELKRLLEKLSKQMRSSSRTEQRYTALLMEINPVIERLDVEKSGLLLSSYLLNDLIAKSLILVDILKKAGEEDLIGMLSPHQTLGQVQKDMLDMVRAREIDQDLWATYMKLVEEERAVSK